MSRYTVHGAFDNPKRAREYARFTHKDTFDTQQEAELIAQEWRESERYPYVWIEHKS